MSGEGDEGWMGGRPQWCEPTGGDEGGWPSFSRSALPRPSFRRSALPGWPLAFPSTKKYKRRMTKARKMRAPGASPNAHGAPDVIPGLSAASLN